MSRVISVVTGVARIGAGLAFAILMAAVLVQVVGRLMGSSPVWTEELTRYALLYMIAFGAGLAFRSGELVNVDVICEALPGKWPWVLRLFSAAVTAGLALYILPHAWRFVSIGKMQTAPALGWRMDFVHLTVFLLLAGLAVFAGMRVLGMLSGKEDGLPDKTADETES